MSVLQGKIALVTAAKGGLGSYVTNAFLAAGANVVGVSRSIQFKQMTSCIPNSCPRQPISRAVRRGRSLAAAVVARFARIDALVHVMGGFAGGTRVDETGDVIFERMLDFTAALLSSWRAHCCRKCECKAAGACSPLRAGRPWNQRRMWELIARPRLRRFQ
jgi:NAD(P)-dependent dehydrogenase (short-subunit alcohol dehydrogenase family)